MVTCASGETLCKDKGAPVPENVQCSVCHQTVHPSCAHPQLDGAEEQTFICLACDERQQEKDHKKRPVELVGNNNKEEEEEDTTEELSTKRLKTSHAPDNDEAKPPSSSLEDDFAPIPVGEATMTTTALADAAPSTEMETDAVVPSPPTTTRQQQPTVDTTAATESALAAGQALTTPTAATAPLALKLTPGMDTGRDITIKQEQFPVPLLDIEHFMNLPESVRKESNKRYLDQPHPSLKSPISPFAEGKGSFSTGWWLAFHHYNRDLPEYKHIRKDIICCNLCGAQVKRGERARATSALVQHLKTKLHRNVFEQLAVLWEGKAHDPLVPRNPKTGPGRKSTGTTATGTPHTPASTVARRKSQDRAHKEQMRAIARWIADTNQPLQVIETESFRKLVKTLQATARFEAKPTAVDVSQEIVALDSQVKLSKRFSMRGRFIWTTQGYSGVESSRGYHYLTAHFITNKFQMASLMLEAKEQVVDPKANSIATEYLEDTAALGMTPGLAYVVGSDDTVNPGFVSSTEVSSATLGAQLEKTKGLLNVEFLDQKLALTAEIAFGFQFSATDDTTVPETRKVLAKAQQLVALLKQNSRRLENLKTIQEGFPGEYKGQELDVIQDCEEFWWSKHAMIGRLLKLRPALEKLWQDDRELDTDKMFDGVEWDVLKQLHIVLQPLIQGVTALENEKVNAPVALVALNMIRGELKNIQSICDGNESHAHHEALLFAPAVSKCVKELLEHFDSVWGSLEEPFQGVKILAAGGNKPKGLHWSILMAYALDPRFKELPHIPSETNKEELWSAVSKEMNLAMKQTKKHANEAEDANKPARESESGLDVSVSEEDPMMLYMKGARSGTKTGETDQDIQEKCSKELEEYKDAASLPFYNKDTGASSDPLNWWEENNERFPTLWSMARVFLSIPVSAASLEKRFGLISSGRDTDELALELPKERMNIRCNELHTGSAEAPRMAVKEESGDQSVGITTEVWYGEIGMGFIRFMKLKVVKKILDLWDRQSSFMVSCRKS